MSEVDDESLYSFGSGQPDDTRAADSTSYSTEWAPLPASGGASPRARSPRSDGASATAALSFSTAAVSADAALDDVDEVESVAAPVGPEAGGVPRRDFGDAAPRGGAPRLRVGPLSVGCDGAGGVCKLADLISGLVRHTSFKSALRRRVVNRCPTRL